MIPLRLATLVLLFAHCTSSLFAADPRDQAIADANAHIKQPTKELLSSLCFVVIGYEGNLPLFKAGTVPPPQNGTGIAVPIDAAGYFLTAAHSVVSEYDMYVVGTFNGQFKALKAEIVYRGNPAQTENDYSILKVQETITTCLTFAPNLPKEGETVYAAVRLQSQAVLAEGTCRTVPDNYGAGRTLVITSDIPVIGGDSGGPLLTSDLKLIGLTSRGMRVWGFVRTQSCCPSMSAIQTQIEHHKIKPSPAASKADAPATPPR